MGFNIFYGLSYSKLTRGKENFAENETKASDFKATPIVNRATFTFILTMLIMLVYGIVAKAGASYAIVMLTANDSSYRSFG